MSRGERKCEKCGRCEYRNPDGEVKPLEVCFSHAHNKWLCLRCYLEDGASF